LLGGEEALARDGTAVAYGGAVGAAPAGDRVGALEAEVQALRTDLAALAAEFAAFKQSFE
jgi:hypothetical protein